VASITILSVITKVLYTRSPVDQVLVVGAWAGCAMAGLLAIRSMVSGFPGIAERVRALSWLSESSVNGVSQRQDEVLVTRYGDEIVGVLVIRIAKAVVGVGTPGTRPSGTRSRRKSSARWTAIIRAWTVKRNYRLHGIGAALLEEAISLCQIRGLEGPVFADDHAYVNRVLPKMFNSGFEKQEAWARQFLEQVIAEGRAR